MKCGGGCGGDVEGDVGVVKDFVGVGFEKCVGGVEIVD